MMGGMGFGAKLDAAAERAGVPVCVGIDPIPGRWAEALEGEPASEALRRFGLGVVEAVAGLVPAVKPQVAYYEAFGEAGHRALAEVVRAAKQVGLLVVLGAKRGDIGSTAEAYAQATLDDAGPMGADAVTLNPYLGPESMAPFVARCEGGKGLFVLVRTSNPGAGAWQGSPKAGLGAEVSAWIRRENERFGVEAAPIGAVVGATVEEDGWRAALGEAWILAPGFGAQGAGAAAARRLAGARGRVLAVSARDVLYPKVGRDAGDWQDGVRERAERFCGVISDALREV